MATREQRDAYLGLVAAGWVLTFTVPVGGLVIGSLLVGRRDGHALAMLSISVVVIVAAVFGYLVLVGA